MKEFVNENGNQHLVLRPMIAKEYQVLIPLVEIVDFSMARALVTDLTDVWDLLVKYVMNSNSLPLPKLPNVGMNIAFRVKKDELRTVLGVGGVKPQHLACILCINEKIDSAKEDDTLSVLFVGVGGDNRPATKVAIEKWDDLYLQKPGGGNYTLKEQATLVKNNLLNVNQTDFKETQDFVDYFEAAWTELLEDLKKPTPGSRPNIKKADHPLAFLINPDEMLDLIGPNDVIDVAGIFGYRKDREFITPSFVGIDANDKLKGTKIVRTHQITSLQISQASTVKQTMLKVD